MDFKKALINVRAFLPDDNEILKIIKICDLKPVKDSWMKWIDSGGNSLILKENKTVVSSTADITGLKNIQITDIHFKASAKKIANLSKWAMVSFAESASDKTNTCFIWFLGNDDKLRLVTFLKSEWLENQFPLSSGIKTLRVIASNLNIETHKVFTKDVDGPIKSNVVKTWITNWPVSNTMKLDMLLTNKTLAQRVLLDCGALN